jgi:hypothetical protein
MSRDKEPNYFNRELFPDPAYGRKDITSEQDYLSLFSDKKKKYLGEGTVHYAYCKGAPKQIYEFNPDSKIIYGIREPLSMLKSMHAQNLKMVFENEKEFEKAIKLEKERRKGKKIPGLCLCPDFVYYAARIKYADHIRRYLKLFGKENIYVYIFEDFRKDNKNTLNQIMDFLNINRIRFSNTRKNTRKNVKHMTLRRIGHSFPNLRKRVRPLIPFLYRKKWGDFINRLTLTEADVGGKEETAYIKKFKKKVLKPEIEKISKLLNKEGFLRKDLGHFWGYS